MHALSAGGNGHSLSQVVCWSSLGWRLVASVGCFPKEHSASRSKVGFATSSLLKYCFVICLCVSVFRTLI